MLETEYGSLSKVKIYGYCSFSKEKIAKLFLAGKEDLILNALGNFVIVWDDNSKVVVVTSATGIVPYYFFSEGQRFAHGNELLNVFQSCQQEWKWDFSALADYLVFDHPINSATLHKKIKRTTANTILRFENGKLHKTTLKKNPKDNAKATTTPEQVIECIRSEMSVWATQSNITLSITGGFDSRLLLATLLSLNIQPNLIVSGQKDSFDLKVSHGISQKFGLPLITTETKAEDITENADKTIRATGGTLPIPHWAGHLWASELKSAAPVIVGFNGELARTYYFDRGIFSYLLNYVPNNYKRNLLGRDIHPEVRGFLNSSSSVLKPYFSEQNQSDRFERMLSFSGSTTLEKLDSFFINAYIKNKTGMDVAALGKQTDWIAPLCSSHIVQNFQCLPRHWKLGSKFHRFAINELFPQLLAFPEEGRGNEMTLKPIALYWKRKRNVIPFYNISILEQSSVSELVKEGLTYLEDILDGKALSTLAKERTLPMKLLSYQLAPVGLFMKLVRDTA